ncbi:MAG: hypothetical protein JO355_02090 [Planctomycetaceae bacterium]|nr:hypothetical protein [Planctomycetaceae bacterium]MBV8268537.1 hypothetical protein [Planctomycetaceae bacterium]MBV8675941.1 hypothetical protein [Planctomycetaceae bacterium]
MRWRQPDECGCHDRSIAFGKPRLTDFRLEETTIPTPGPGQVLLRVRYLSLDPYMRGRMDDRESYAPPAPLGGGVPGMSSEGGET